MEQLAIGTAAALLVGYVALAGAALLQIFRARIPHALRLGWFAAVLLAPPFGVLVWLLFGHPAAPFPVVGSSGGEPQLRAPRRKEDAQRRREPSPDQERISRSRAG